MIVTDLFGGRMTRGQEIVNALTHGAGLVLSIAGLVLLVVKASVVSDAYGVVSAAIFGSGMVILYASSTIYHGVRKIRLKYFLRILDHSAIYVLIASTYTPFCLVLLRDHPYMGWPLFFAMWFAAFTGITFKSMFVHKYDFISTMIYIAMGWAAVIGFSDVIGALEPGGVILLVAGGLSYTLGTVFYFWTSLWIHHAMWHLFVLSGTICHFFTVFFYVL